VPLNCPKIHHSWTLAWSYHILNETDDLAIYRPALGLFSDNVQTSMQINHPAITWARDDTGTTDILTQYFIFAPPDESIPRVPWVISTTVHHIHSAGKRYSDMPDHTYKLPANDVTYYGRRSGAMMRPVWDNEKNCKVFRKMPKFN
jgi:hypothetical protein